MGGVWTMHAESGSADKTRALAARLAALAEPGDVILLVGGLGAGKTTFVQGFARGLGVDGPVTSPTFTLVRAYPCSSARGVSTLVHADVYRLDTLGEIADLGLAELLDEARGGRNAAGTAGAVALVEWGDAAAPVLGDEALTVALEPVAGDDDRRRVTLEGRGEPWARRERDVAEVLAR